MVSEGKIKSFISYSHRDSAVLERLHTHLAMLKREGKITAWYDREIKAGGVIEDEIEEQLESCDVFLALVSPDFLSSHYCYEKEMEQAIERHARGELRIVPLILEPCDWTSSPLGQFKALPKDGKPISDWANQNTAFLDIVRELRRLAEAEQAPADTRDNAASTGEVRKYRIKRKFDQVDRDDFRQAAFVDIKNLFEEWISELNAVNGLKARFEGMDATSFSCMALNQDFENRIAHITVRTRTGYALGDIYYSFAERASEGTAHGAFQVDADEFELFIRYQGFGPHSLDNKKLSSKEAAEILWEDFLEQAGVSHV